MDTTILIKTKKLFKNYSNNGFATNAICSVPFEIKKWGSDKFIDLFNRIKQSHGYKLEILCKAFGIENPKEAGVHGGDVNELFDNKDFQKIADYVARDAFSTSRLYMIWKEYMSGN